jgi:chemotaxis protein CheC
VISAICGTEEMVVAVLVEFSGDAKGMVLFILSMDDARHITDILVGKDPVDTHVLSEMKISAIKEIGNILGSSYIGSVAEFTGMKINISVPHLAVDMAGAILEAPMTQYGVDESRIMYIEESFTTDRNTIISHVIMFAGIDTLHSIMERLGIDG